MLPLTRKTKISILSTIVSVVAIVVPSQWRVVVDTISAILSNLSSTI